MDPVNTQLVAAVQTCPQPEVKAYALELAAATDQLIVRASGPQLVRELQFLWILAAILWQETRAGTTHDLKPLGPAGTGDWSARAGHWCGHDHVRIINSAAELPPGWVGAMRSVQVNGRTQWVPRDFPWCITDDGLGWGRGLCQVDFGSNWDWLQLRDGDGGPFLWTLPAPAILKGGQILLAHLEAFPGRLDAGAGAYNAGDAAVHGALAAGKPPGSVTEGGTYVRNVMRDAGTWGAIPELVALAV